MNLSEKTVEQCRDRGGDAAEDRDESLEDALTQPQLGFRDGQPLAADSYGQYPERTDLARPEYGDFLERLLGHDMVGDAGDAVAELTGANDRGALTDWVRTVEAAAEAHGLDTDSLFEGGGQEGGSPLTAVVGYEPPADMVESDNPLLIAELYASGLSVEEIADTLSQEVDGSVTPAAVRDSLKDVGLIEGKTRAETMSDFEDNGARLGGASMETVESGDSRGITVNANDYA